MFDLEEELSRYDCLDLLAKVGGLLLDPSNASRAGSLYSLSHLIVSISPSDNAPAIPRAQLVALLDKHFGTGSEFAETDDPAPQMFTEEFNFSGGPYIVFPGHIADGQDSLRWLLKSAIFQLDPSVYSESFLEEIHWVAWLCLKASNEIGRAAGLQRGIVPKHDESGEIAVSSAEVLNGAATAVTFSRPELQSLLPANVSLKRIIGPLTVALGEVALNPDGSHSRELFTRPFVNLEDTYVVPDPSSLVTGLRDRVLRIAKEYGIIGLLGDAYHTTITLEVQELLEGWGYQPCDAPLPEQPIRGFSEKLYSLDHDKVLYLQVATDNLSDPPEANQLANWDVVQLEENLEQRNADMVRHLSTLGVPKDRVMTLTVLQPCRQMYVNDSGHHIGDTIHLTMSANQLKVLTLLDSEDQLALWKFGRSRQLVRESAFIISTDLLDEYELYRMSPRGYFLPEEAMGLSFIVPPGAGLHVVKEVHERLDPHVVPSFVPGKLTEVWNVPSSDVVPISAPSFSSQMGMPLVVEGDLPLPVWVVPAGSVSDWPVTIPDVLSWAFASTIWRFEDLFDRWLSRLPDTSRVFVIQLVFDPITNWSETIEFPGVEVEGTEPPVLSFSPTESGIMIHLHPGLLRTLNNPSLLGRRVLVREFLEAMQDAVGLATGSEDDVVTDDELDSLIDTKLPSGHIKEMTKRVQDSLLLGDPLERLPFRTVQDVDVWMLQEMGWRHLKDEFESKGLLTTVKDRCDVINALVEYFYGELQAMVKTLDGNDIVMKLISCNEANVFQTEHHSVSALVLSSIASIPEDFIEDLTADRENLDQASLSNRFLVEYVAACLPEGNQPLTIEVFDRLLALSSLICYWGGFSDYVKFGLIDENIELRPSGRLIWDTSSHRLSSRAFRLNFTRGKFSEFQRNVDTDNLGTPEVVTEIGELSPESEILNEAYREEFGLSLKELSSLIGEIWKIGDDQEDPAKQLHTLELVTLLVQSLRWDREKVILGLELLTLTQRQDFLRPPEGEQWETYPWRYSRSWSHLRRPLVRIGYGSDSLIIWGNRSLVMTLYHLDELCLSGRINATTKRLKRAVTKIRQLEAEEFEVHVSDLVGTIDGVQAKPSVKKIGKRRIGRPGRDLGDIDVLGVIPELQVVLCIECKDFSLARTAAEIQHQMEEIVAGSRGQTPTVEKHLARVEWVKENLGCILKQCFDIDRQGGWMVKPILVSDGELYATYLRSLPFENWTIERLRSATKHELAAPW